MTSTAHHYILKADDGDDYGLQKRPTFVHDTIAECEATLRILLSEHVRRFLRKNPIIKECGVSVEVTDKVMEVLREIAPSSDDETKTVHFICSRAASRYSVSYLAGATQSMDLNAITDARKAPVTKASEKRMRPQKGLIFVQLTIDMLRRLTATQRKRLFFTESKPEFRQSMFTLVFNGKSDFFYDEKQYTVFMQMVDSGGFKIGGALTAEQAFQLFLIVEAPKEEMNYTIIGPVMYRPRVSDIKPFALDSDDEEEEEEQAPKKTKKD